MSEETKTKVKDLPETERAELIKQMELAGCLGNLGEYKVETAKTKIEEWQKSQGDAEENNGGNIPEQSGQNDSEKQKTQNATNSGIAPINTTPTQAGRGGLGRSSTVGTSTTADPVEQKSLDLPGVETSKNQPGQNKKLICHICRSEVINGICTGCGLSMRR